MAKANYTFNQMGATFTLMYIQMWAIARYVIADFLGHQRFFPFIPLHLIGWILFILIIKKYRPAYIASIIPNIMAMTAGILVPLTSDVPGWYVLEKVSDLLINLSFIIFYPIAILHVYFCYKSFIERGPKVYEKFTYTNSQVGAIATFLGVLGLMITSQGLEMILGIAQPILILSIIIGWAIFPFYIKRNKIALVIGAVVVSILIIGISITNSIRERVIFPSLSEEPISTLIGSQLYWIFSVFYTISFVCILFSYLTYKEFE